VCAVGNVLAQQRLQEHERLNERELHDFGSESSEDQPVAAFANGLQEYVQYPLPDIISKRPLAVPFHLSKFELTSDGESRLCMQVDSTVDGRITVFEGARVDDEKALGVKFQDQQEANFASTMQQALSFELNPEYLRTKRRGVIVLLQSTHSSVQQRSTFVVSVEPAKLTLRTQELYVGAHILVHTTLQRVRHA
jgi:hypothetical protein